MAKKTHPIRLFRNLADLRQYEVADQIGRNQSWLSQVERGRAKPSESDLDNLAKVLGVEAALLKWSSDDES